MGSIMSKQLLRANIMDIFVKKPILSIVVSLVLVLAGLQAIKNIPILQFPQIESSSLIITTTYTGASAEIVQGFITEPIERVASTIPGVDYVDSNTTAGLSTVTVWLKLNENSTKALAELSSRIDQINSELPTGAETPSVSVQRADRAFAAFYLPVVINDLSRGEVGDYLTRQVNPMLSAIEGVQRIDLAGARNPAMRVWLDPIKMNAFNISATDVSIALAKNNVIATVGYTENKNQRIDLLTDSTMQNISDFEQLILRESKGALIKLNDIARIELAEEEGLMNFRYSQKDAVSIAVWPLPGANEISIADDLYKVIDEINTTLPHNLKIEIGYDSTVYMRQALREIFITLIETIILVGLVVVALMGSFRSALVPLVTIPISILGAIATMSIMGFSLNLLTILAIVLSVGLVVDDAIVVVENVSRHMREGMSRTQAALNSSRELFTPIVAMTITLAVVYIPIGFLSGLTGVLFKEFAFTLAVAVLMSGLIAVTLSAIMSAHVLPEGGHEGKVTIWVNHHFDRLHSAYGNLLERVFLWKKQIVLLAVFITLLIPPFYIFSQKELAPIEDQNSINIIIEAPPEASLEYTTNKMKQVVNTLLETPGSKMMWQVILPSSAFGGVIFNDFDKREQSVQQLLPSVFYKLSQIAGLKAMPVLSPSLPTAGQFDVEMVIQSPDSYQEMERYANKLLEAGYRSGKFMFLNTDLKIDLPQIRFKLDRDRIADLGMNLADVSDQLGLLISSNYVNRFDSNGKAYRVIPMIDGQSRSPPDALLQLQLRTPNGELIPVDAIASLEKLTAPRVLGKFDQKKSFRIFAGVLPGTTKEQGLAALEKIASELLPRNYTIDYAGESRQLRKEGSTLISVLFIALVLVYLILTVQFNNFRDPLVVLLGSVPLAISGALLFPFLGWTSINIYSQIGFITLVGLIAKNGILIVEFANHMQQQGLNKLKAVKMAAETRLRPILMTSAATILGHFPLVLVTGAGAEARNSIGIILVAGMLIGTFFTLIVLPCIYLLLAKTHPAEVSIE